MDCKETNQPLAKVNLVHRVRKCSRSAHLQLCVRRPLERHKLRYFKRVTCSKGKKGSGAGGAGDRLAYDLLRSFLLDYVLELMCVAGPGLFCVILSLFRF